jgi:hypothetical protein
MATSIVAGAEAARQEYLFIGLVWLLDPSLALRRHARPPLRPLNQSLLLMARILRLHFTSGSGWGLI